jgi:hypothetical protein
MGARTSLRIAPALAQFSISDADFESARCRRSDALKYWRSVECIAIRQIENLRYANRSWTEKMGNEPSVFVTVG